MITGEGIEKSYGNLRVLKGVDFEVQKGEIVAVVGPSGAGKSTLLHIIGTLDNPDAGHVVIEGINPAKLGSKALADFRNKNIGFIFQFHHLLPEFSAIENVCIPGYIAGKSKSAVQPLAKDLLTELGLGDRLNHKPSALSGGEQQRVAVARALINRPTVILADEPSGNLDTHNARELHKLFFDLRDKYNQTFIIVTHNDELAGMANRKLVMRDGKIIESVTTHEEALI
jgi:lipoprotein-releasing system ATP-binding protein